MRKINKGQVPKSLERFRKNNPSANWDTLSNEATETKSEMSILLLEEQNYLCAYTELPIDKENSHTDHFRLKNVFPNQTFDWNNLLRSCNSNGNEFGAMHKDSSFKIGSKREVYSQIYNPIEDDVGNYFYYNRKGEIEAIDEDYKSKVDKTIEVFNLNHQSLCRRRKNLIENVSSMKDSVDLDVIISAFQNEGFKSVVEQALK